MGGEGRSFTIKEKRVKTLEITLKQTYFFQFCLREVLVQASKNVTLWLLAKVRGEGSKGTKGAQPVVRSFF